MNKSKYFDFLIVFNCLLAEGICPEGWHIPSVEEFFDDMIASKNFLDIDIKNDDKVLGKNNIISFGRKSIKRLADDGGISNSNMELAYMRSKALQLLIHEMEAQVQISYK